MIIILEGKVFRDVKHPSNTNNVCHRDNFPSGDSKYRSHFSAEDNHHFDFATHSNILLVDRIDILIMVFRWFWEANII